jgi:hypothetical protein
VRNDKIKRRKNNLHTATLLTGTTILVGEINIDETNIKQGLTKEVRNGDDNIITITFLFTKSCCTFISITFISPTNIVVPVKSVAVYKLFFLLLFLSLFTF